MGDNSNDSDVITYLISEAPDDVAQTISWLSKSGFNVTRQHGGRDASFGNVLAVWERQSLKFKIVRDRSQWMIDVAAPGLPFAHLAYLLTAKDDYPIVTSWEGALPQQLPPGVTWNTVIPELVIWIEAEDRRAEIQDASDRWQSAMRNSFRNNFGSN